MSDQQYPKRSCDIDVTFIDGQVQTYRITAGASIAPHLAKQAGETGILTLLGGPKAFCIPVGQIREWTVTEIPEESK